MRSSTPPVARRRQPAQRRRSPGKPAARCKHWQPPPETTSPTVWPGRRPTRRSPTASSATYSHLDVRHRAHTSCADFERGMGTGAVTYAVTDAGQRQLHRHRRRDDGHCQHGRDLHRHGQRGRLDSHDVRLPPRPLPRLPLVTPRLRRSRSLPPPESSGRPSVSPTPGARGRVRSASR